MSRRRVALIAPLLLLSVLAPAGPPATAAPAQVAPAASTTRYFGSGAFQAVQTAVAALTPTCAIDDDRLTAMVLAPAFFESSAATTPDTAPAPMTLSRYDEWNGVYGTSAPSSNYGLYAFRDPYTAYPRAFWSPGLGIWQFDGGGLGAPLTTVEAMDVSFVAGVVAKEIARLYCGASGTTAQRRDVAWGPWAGCNAVNTQTGKTLCEEAFLDLYTTTPHFENLGLVGGIGPLGGVVQHTCVLSGVAGTMPCWYVNPSVGVIQGATGWATYEPDGFSNPKKAPAPLPKPFYVLDRGTTEERHWLRVDTGYDKDIVASRTIGKSPRASSQTGSGLAWRSTSGLCDITAGRGVCVPVPPAGVSSSAVSVISTNRAIPLDVGGNGVEDVLWYGTGTSADLLWLGTGSGGFTPRSLSITGTYDDLLPGDVDGDGDDDVVLYQRSTGRAYLLRSKGDGTFTIISLSVGSGRRPFLYDADGNGDQEIFWYGPGSIPDSLWSWAGTAFSQRTRAVAGTYTPLVGDYDGNGLDDVFWYVPGPAVDKLWLSKPGSTFPYSPYEKPVAGTYRVVVGDLDGDDHDDLVWYAPGSTADTVWFGGSAGSFTPGALSVVGDYQPIIANLGDDDRDELYFYAPGSGSDYRRVWAADRSSKIGSMILPGQHTAAVGRFSAGGADGILWYIAGQLPDTIWWR